MAQLKDLLLLAAPQASSKPVILSATKNLGDAEGVTVKQNASILHPHRIERRKKHRPDLHPQPPSLCPGITLDQRPSLLGAFRLKNRHPYKIVSVVNNRASHHESPRLQLRPKKCKVRQHQLG